MFRSFRIILATFVCVISAQLASADPFKLYASATSFTTPVFIGTHMYLTASGTGSANHLGNLTFTAPHDFDLAAGTYVSDAYVMASNGDILHIVSNGQFINAVDSIATWTIQGGTGRFINATGSGTATNLNFGQSITFTGDIEGIID